MDAFEELSKELGGAAGGLSEPSLTVDNRVIWESTDMLKEFGPSLYIADGPVVSFFGFPYPQTS